MINIERRDSVKFFIRFLLVTVITFITVGISVVLTGVDSDAGLIIAVLIMIVNVFFLLLFLVLAIAKLIKHIFDKEKNEFDFMYIVNFLFTLLISGIFLTFYFVIIAAAMIFLLPFYA